MEMFVGEISGQHIPEHRPLLGRWLECVQELRKVRWICYALLAVSVLISMLAKYKIIDSTSDGGELFIEVAFTTIAVIGLIIGTSIWWLHREIRKINAELARTTHS